MFQKLVYYYFAKVKKNYTNLFMRLFFFKKKCNLSSFFITFLIKVPNIYMLDVSIHCENTIEVPMVRFFRKNNNSKKRNVLTFSLVNPYSIELRMSYTEGIKYE